MAAATKISLQKRMDLLRLVLCRQPLMSLFRFKKLLGSPAFIRTRIERVNPRGYGKQSDENYIRLCSAQGEITSVSYLYISMEDIRARSVFLRDAKSYRYYYDSGAESDIGFWSAMASGILDIQVTALTMITLNPNATRILYGCYDPWTIPWTDQLAAEVVRLISTHAGKDDLSFLKGFLGVQSSPTSGSWNEYIRGRIMFKFKGRETWIEDAEIEALLTVWPNEDKLRMWNTDINNYSDLAVAFLKIETGYLANLNKYLTSDDPNDSALPELRGTAVGHCCIGAMKLLLQGINVDVSFQGYDIDEKMESRVRVVLEDQNLVYLISQTSNGEETLADYRVIAGEVTSDIISPLLRRGVGNPGPETTYRVIPSDVETPDIILRNFIYNPVYSASVNFSYDPGHAVEVRKARSKILADSVTYVQGSGDLNPYLLQLYDGPDQSWIKSNPTDFNPGLVMENGLVFPPEVLAVMNTTYKTIWDRLAGN